jgi:hypothetical protein
MGSEEEKVPAAGRWVGEWESGGLKKPVFFM